MDWTIKPLISTYGSINKTEIANIVKSIIKGESHILDHEEQYSSFYISFLALSADAISGQCNQICSTQFAQTNEAVVIVIKYILKKIENAADSTRRQLLLALKGLCEGKSCIPSSDQTVLVAMLKNATPPEASKVNLTSGEKDSPKSEVKRSRFDLSSAILQQLVTPLTEASLTWTPISDDQADCSQSFIKSNTTYLQSINAGDTILNMCVSLPVLARYRLKYEESALQGRNLYLPLTPAEASNIKYAVPQMASDIQVLSTALSLPIIEPLTPNKIIQLSQCAMSALYCAILASVYGGLLNMSSGSSGKGLNTQQSQNQNTPGKDSTGGEGESTEESARTVVNKALEIFGIVGNIFKNSTRDHIYHNHYCMGAWLMISGIQGTMGIAGTSTNTKQASTDDGKGKSPSRNLMEQQVALGRVNLFKVQQNFGVLNDAIASLCLTLLTDLIEDLKVESRSGDDQMVGGNIPEPAGFDILGQYTSFQRVVRVLTCTTLQQLLTFLATVSYRKACSLRRATTKNPNDDDPISFSDSTTYFNETIICSEDSETEEDDSESYLGLWFKETLSPEAKEDPNDKQNQENQNENGAVAAKDEPHEYLELSAQIFTFLDTSLGCTHKYLVNYVKTGLSEQQIVLLANILKDLDRDAARCDPEGLVCVRWQVAMDKFAGSLGRYLHNLISNGIINETLQSSLLLHLGVSPWTYDLNIWPLQVYPRTLAVLVQIILLKPLQEKEAACLSVWHRLVNTLVEGVCSPKSETDYEDLNVEHAQLLLFLFHSLNLMQKKSILLLTAGGVTRCAEVCRYVTPDKPLKDSQIILLSRLLLFLDYLMKHLYNAPNILLEQVRWNLFSVITLESSQKFVADVNKKTKMLSFCKKDIEDKFKKWDNDLTMTGSRPKFYSLTAIDTKLQQEFKLDGLAWNFILCTPDKLKYQLLVDSLTDILGVVDICMGKVSYSTLCAVHYCFGLAWKLLLGLPPSTPHVEGLVQEKIPNLHSLMWSIKCQYSTTEYLIENSLIKQGMYTEDAKSLWKKVTAHVSDVKYSLKLTNFGLVDFCKNFQIQSPRLSKIMLLDGLISHLNVILTQENGSKSKSESSVSTLTQTSIADPPEGFLAKTKSVQSPSETPDVQSRESLAIALIPNLVETIELLKEALFKTALKVLPGRINAPLMASLITISNAENHFCPEISSQLMNLLSGPDMDVIKNLWSAELKLVNDGNIPQNTQQPVEYHTLQIIDGHVSEISNSSNFNIYPFLAHPLKPALTLLNNLLQDQEIKKGLNETELNRIKNIIIPLIFDVRAEFVFKTASKTLELLFSGDNSTESEQIMSYTFVLKHSYKFIIDYAELSSTGAAGCPDELILHQIFKFWEYMLEKPIGMRVMHNFFCETKQGSLVEILLSFSNTNMSQPYTTKVLQFFEKLFQAAEKKSSAFSLNDLCECVSELGNVEPVKLKNWLSHILLGPGGLQTNSSNSSNVQTPTNMANTVSGIPGNSDDLGDNIDMEIDYECGAVGGGSSIWQQQNPQSSQQSQAQQENQPGISATTNRSELSNEDCLEKNGRLLQSLTKYIISENRISSTVSSALFSSLIQIGQNLLCPAQDALDFTDLLQVMVTLADANQGKGHSQLFESAIDWLDVSKNQVIEKALTKLNGKTMIVFENVTSLLKYLSDLLQGLGSTGSRLVNPPWEEDNPPDVDDFIDDVGQDDEDSTVEDSDEDSLGNKLCTFSITQKEFMNQHWYHCHTCKMVDGAGVCSVCAKVCHKNHDISYAKYGNFFCDCGAKEDGSCQALSRRVSNSGRDGSSNQNSNTEADQMIQSSMNRRVSSPTPPQNLMKDGSSSNMIQSYHLAKIIEKSKDQLIDSNKWKSVVKFILDFIDNLMPAIKENCAKYSSVGCHARAKNAIDRLHKPDKIFCFSDEIMIPALGTQESAFENVRMNYSGEQGQTIRQLITTNLVRRVALCCLASPHGKRQHLAVALEKGKVLIFQLSILLKQDAAKRKLTLNRLASAPINCTVLSMASNPANEDYLAVCGLKECHILTFTTNGTVKDHIVLTPQLETGNFIKRAIWLPGSQTQLALVTADFVKIYDLAKDSYSPEYYFLLPSGKIRDCTFMKQEDTYYLLLMASSGYIYTQGLTSESLAQHGSFYVTNTLELDHPHIKHVSGQIGGGGVSIYYSHVLQLLFFSYSQGRSFMAPLTNVNEGVKCVIHLQTSLNTKTSSKGPPQPLCQWSEIAGHHGLICAMMQTSNNPVIFMIKPDAVFVQEIKATSSKAKIMDMVAIRHSVYGVDKTTLILLCEDGNLRIHTANPENTNYWMSPEVQPITNTFSSFSTKSSKRKKNSNKTAQNAQTGPTSSGPRGSTSGATANPTFPIDFFEYCTVMPDVEFGGNHLLQIYNKALLKHRLNATGLYVASTRINGFTLEVINNDANMVITGIRISIGNQSIQKAPVSVTIHGRAVKTIVTRPRWFDIPLTWEESLQSDKKLSITFGPSQDPEDVCMLDSIKIYGKTKDVFGWPEEQDDIVNGVPVGSATGSINAQSGLGNGQKPLSGEGDCNSFQTITNLDKMISVMLEVLDSGIAFVGINNVEEEIKKKAIDISTHLLIQPTPNCVQNNAKCVLASLFGNRQQYHQYKDKQILSEVNTNLEALFNVKDAKEIDPEAFYRLVMMVRGVAVTRPQSLTKICCENKYEIVPMLMEMMKRLYEVTPSYEEPIPIVKRGLCHTELIIQALVEIVYAFALSQSEMVDLMTEHLVTLLLDKTVVISHSTKQALIKLLRPRTKRRKAILASPPICNTPTPSSSVVSGIPAGVSAEPVSDAAQSASNQRVVPVEVDAGVALLGNQNDNLYNQIMQELEPIVNPDGAPEDILDLIQDVDDDEFLEVAIAMSLQDNDNALNTIDQEIVSLQALRGRALQTLQALSSGGAPSGSQGQALEARRFGDPIPSAGGSDDEGSNAATDGSTLRTSPAEHAGSGGSESGGSGVESIGGASGRSSTYGDQPNQSPPTQTIQPQPSTSAQPGPSKVQAGPSTSAASPVEPSTSTAQEPAPAQVEADESAENENIQKLHVLRCAILEKMIDKVDKLDGVGGIQAIPFMQVIHLLTMDLDGSQEMGQRVMNKLLTVFIKKLEMVSSTPASEMRNQTPKSEVQWLILRMFSVFMGKVKSSSSSKSSSSTTSGSNLPAITDQPSTSSSRPNQSSSTTNENIIFFATSTANALMKNGAIPYCLLILESFLPYWTNITNEDEGTSQNAKVVNNLLEPTQYGPVPDMMPFYTAQKVYSDPYESYPPLITEIAMKLLYQILKLSSGQPSCYDWNQSICEYMTYVLCEYMMYWQTQSLRRQVRKLLLYICGNKEKYRRMRDIHALNTHMKAVKKCSDPNLVQTCGAMAAPILNYDGLVELTEHLRACQEIASVRTGNWQLFCFIHSDILPSLLKISCQQLDDGISPIILQLLQSALCNSANGKIVGAVDMKALIKERRDREKSEESEVTPTEHKFDPLLCTVLVSHIFGQVPGPILTKFIKNFLLETNSTNLRWQAHSLIYAFYENSNQTQKEQLLSHLWSLWPLLSAYGRRTAQFVDLIGYLTLNTKTAQIDLLECTRQAVNVLRQQNELLSSHPNAGIYSSLSQVLQVDGFYLESEPCLVCNNPEVPMTNIKLSSIKIDSKFTTTTTLVKLVYSHTISKINLRIADLKRTKMVKVINIYYNNRSVQAIVELKNRPTMWHKARRVTLSSGQTDVKIEFPLPITACNLMIEYADFYETVTGSNENLQCPRCSAAVPANPGVCSNCGENVFQCHKCRAINYDEKDPFLCHSCGFCKYAKFDYTIYGRVCCAVDPIESAEDQTKTVQLIYALLIKADVLYRQLQINREDLELLLQKNPDDKIEPEDLFGINNTSQVNKVIQNLSHKYCVESKASFEDLSKIIQKVQASRRELVAYDRSQMDIQTTPVDVHEPTGTTTNKCYGCALASTEHCLTLLRALASNPTCQAGLCEQGLVGELAFNNLRRGTPQIQSQVRALLCLLTKDNLEATKSLCTLIRNRVTLALSGSVPLANLDIAVHHEMSLLMEMVANDDKNWEEKLKTVFELFTQACQDTRGPAVVVIKPCLKIIQSLMSPPAPISEKNKNLKSEQLTTIGAVDGVSVSYEMWLKDNPNHSYDVWKKRMPPNSTQGDSSPNSSPASSPPVSPNVQNCNSKFSTFLQQIRMRYRSDYLCEKYGKRWRQKVLSKGVPIVKLELQPSWLQKTCFNPNSVLIRSLCHPVVSTLSTSYTVKKELLNLFTEFLKYVGDAGEASNDFMTMYLTLAETTPWRQYLALKGVLITIAELITTEIEKIHRLEETTVSSDLVQGYALHRLVDLLQMFLENGLVLKAYKGKLLGPVLQGYLSLRKLVVQRTRLIDEAQEKLLEMLEEMTTGTNEETRDFIAVLIETVDKTPMNDIKTPVFIFERLCSIIHPEENDVEEFFLTLEKDQQQEDYLQGRMLGNPYPSTAAGLGPLMRDVKNKICTDCELVALLEDDNGMELLVHNKIISLDLPVKEVYKKVWLAEGGNRDGMRIVYRMRGLLGDATEEFVETLNNKSQEEVDNEKLYKMANVLADCGGLRVMLDRIGSLHNISSTRPLLQVLLKLFLLSVKVRRCQTVLCQPELGAINSLLKVLQLCLQSGNDSQQAVVTEQLLEIMETILSKAASDTLDSFLQFSLTFGGPEYVQALITCTSSNNIQNNPSVLRHLIRVLAALVYGNDIKMALLCEHFKGTLDFPKFDTEHNAEEDYKMELFCILANQIEHNSIGGTLKDYIISLGIVDRALEYITTYAPQVKTTLQRTDSDELKEFMSRPSLKYILRFLSGLCTKHEATQVAVSKDIIPIVHQLEQVSSDEHVGCLAENLLEALSTDPATAQRVQQVREFTRAEKKRLAMATREKQLDALGMRTNEKGQVTAKGSILQKIEKLRDETGLTCFICREGYACQPTKVLGIYTFTKRTYVEPYEVKRKTFGYTTVTHFNVVHIECHMAALRTARGRDEWESASLQNANTRCNGLLPLWGPEVSEAAFSSCMNRHNSYMQESTQRCEITFTSSVHDLKLLLNRFAFEKSFHEDAGGGGPQSNMHLVPYLLFYGLYILLSSRSFSREEKTLTTYLTSAVSDRWMECCYEVEGPLYQITLSLALHTPANWAKYRIQHLKRLLVCAQVRHISPSVVCKSLGEGNRIEMDYSVYKGYLMFWALIDLIYKNFFKSVTTPKEEDWPISLFDYLRRNDEGMLKSSESVLSTFTDEYLPCTSFGEFCDVAGLLSEIEEPDFFIMQLFWSLPSADGGSSSPPTAPSAGPSSANA